MPSIDFDADDITTPAELFGILVDLNAQGWRGAVSVASLSTDPDGEMGWRLQVSKDATSQGGLPSLMEAHIGDKKVVFNGVISVLTQADYTAMYGVS
ncbi:hypothetical protein [Mycobacterium sp. AZCC_0083]|uniref:hypothetical protein n=1 Tax=Mycobacterium sp. AZCC_0083 TaxID=2735882 RepID=UPI001609FB35|nr:hypothetical protein [Mycobacterium sp. AZCC_0083]MBB5167197.1 hypothetical protein [Mycobacterium sp. AZCC_0083]